MFAARAHRGRRTPSASAKAGGRVRRRPARSLGASSEDASEPASGPGALVAQGAGLSAAAEAPLGAVGSPGPAAAVAAPRGPVAGARVVRDRVADALRAAARRDPLGGMGRLLPGGGGSARVGGVPDGAQGAGALAEAAVAAQPDVRWHFEPQHRRWAAGAHPSALRHRGVWGHARPPRNVTFAPTLAEVVVFDPAEGASDRACSVRVPRGREGLRPIPRDPG